MVSLTDIYKIKESDNALIKQLQTLLSICNILSRLHNLGFIHGDLGFGWVINIRGSYKSHTFDFLKEHLGEKLYHYDLQSSNGWFHDTRVMLKDINSDYIFFWIV